MPASVSIRSVFGSFHAMWSRPGMRITPAAPYALHCSPAAVSLSGSHVAAACAAAGGPAWPPRPRWTSLEGDPFRVAIAMKRAHATALTNSDATGGAMRPGNRSSPARRIGRFEDAQRPAHERPQRVDVVRIHRGRAALRGFEGEAVSDGELVKIRVRSWQTTWNDAARAIDFFDDLTRIRRHLLVQIELVVRGADERLGQIHRVVHDRGHRQHIAMTHPV